MVAKPLETDTVGLTDADKPVKESVVKMMFIVLFILEVLLNFDSGATPAVLEFLTVDFRLSPSQQGMLGAFPYIGTLFMSPFAGQLLSRYNPKICVCISLLLNTFFCGLFALSPQCNNASGNCAGTYILLSSKLCIGISQACVLIYLPVWVDEFAIPSLRTLWMSLLQAGIPLGVMLGYLFSGYLAEKGKMNPPFCHKETPLEFSNCCGTIADDSCTYELWRNIDTCCGTEELQCGDTAWNLDKCCKPFECEGGCWYCQWKYAIFFQVCLLIPLCIACCFVPSRYFTTNKSVGGEKENDDEKEETRGGGDRDSLTKYIDGGRDASNISVWKQVRILWRSRVFVWTTLGLSSLYFVVAGIQFWITQYLVEVLQVPYADALSAFTIVSATGPVFGVIFGGWFVDYMGGYRGVEGVARTTKIILFQGFFAICVAVPAAFTTNIGALMPLIWFLLFFGGSIVPAAVGIILSAVPPSIRPFSSSVSMVVYNILGHSAGTLLPGVVMDIQAKASGCSIIKEESSVELEPCAKDILTHGMRIVLLWSFFSVVTFGRSGWKAHSLLRKATHDRIEHEQGEGGGEDGQKAEDKNLDTPLPPRGKWNPVTEAEGVALTNAVERDQIYDITPEDVEEELKRRNTYMPGSGLYNASHTEFGEVFPKLGKLQDKVDAKVRGGLDKVRRINKRERGEAAEGAI